MTMMTMMMQMNMIMMMMVMMIEVTRQRFEVVVVMEGTSETSNMTFQVF